MSVQVKITCILLVSYINLFAQRYTDRGPENRFATTENPYYWKNKRPSPGYWQQDVHYIIDAEINEETGVITGKETLHYTNNSPDTLWYVFFNLYQNAFTPGSYLDQLQQANDAHVHYGPNESAGLGTVVDTISDREGQLETQLDNTILKVNLRKPLLPGNTTTFELAFRTFYDQGSTRRRMKKFKSGSFTHFNGCQWYPKICVYDMVSRWNTDQHLNREFYGDFGTFDVSLTFASNYIVEATGVLQNEDEVLHDTLKQKIHIENFKDKKWEEKPSVVIPYVKGEKKTWMYHAENVHDFAFTANPNYRMADTVIYPGRLNGDGVRCVALVQEQHASGWQTAHHYLAKIISVFSRDFGVFEYPKIIVADAADGMEYPMLTLDGGKDPEYRGLLVHEVAHNWFYGMLGNNETYRAFLDEGFTQLLTVWGQEAIDGDTIVYTPIKNWYVRRFYEPMSVRDSRAYVGYLQDAIRYNDEPLNTHSDGFNGALGQGGGYRHVYVKTATMLYNLQYVLGDSLFLNAMKHYVAKWKFCHPYPLDFRNSITEYTKQNLNWFFDEWLETTKNIDYAVGRIQKGRSKDEYNITFKRKGRMHMPLDFTVKANDGNEHRYYIPNSWFQKQQDSVTVLPKWYGWDKLQPTYKAMVVVPGGINDVVIDPSNRLADINMLDNRKKNRTEFRFDSGIYPYTSWKKYRIWMRPDIWWNAFDGVKLGVHLHGNYMQVKHRFAFTAWLNSHVGQGAPWWAFSKKQKAAAGWFSYNFSYSTAIDKVLKNSTVYFQSRWLDGFEMYTAGLNKGFGNNLTLDIHFKAFTRPRAAWSNYLLYPGEWSTYWPENNGFNNTINASIQYRYAKTKVQGKLTVRGRSTALLSNSDYHYLTLEHTNKVSFWKFDLLSRIYGRLGTGNRLPAESALFFGGANPEEMMESKYYRAAGFVPQTWADRYRDNTSNLHMGGGLNMRGYVGYLLPVLNSQQQIQFAYKGHSGLSANVELEFNRLVKVKKPKLREYFDLKTYLFADGGTITYINPAGKQQFIPVRVDAGAGIAFTIKKWGVLQNAKPLTFRFDVPFFLSHTPHVSPRHFDFRWVVGINRAF
jgi:hypothetical protein